ncbi:hypothetical protein TNCV_3244611 [Trichonephila clavipes]|nr:hypothetical protein TNCV_3244611 [Trichonephila clavipes]
MDKEINVMKERKVWDLVDHPDNIKILENRWVYTIKYDENNKIVRYKARLVARGDSADVVGLKVGMHLKGFSVCVTSPQLSVMRWWKIPMPSMEETEAQWK